MLLRRNDDAHLPVRLLLAGVPVTGIVVADLLGTGVFVTLNGPTPGYQGALVLVDADSWREVDAAAAPGLYIARVPSTLFQAWIPWGGRADLTWSVMPAATDFDAAGFIGHGVVEDLPQHVAGFPLERALVRTLGQASRLWRQMLAGRVKVDVATNIRSLFHEDGVAALAQVNTLDSAALPSTDPIFETTEIAEVPPVVGSVTP
jgi:hypothetical protein